VSSVTPAQVFAALGEPSRQRLLELLAQRGRASATALAAPMAVTRQAVDKHLQVLKRAGLVEAVRQGREVLYGVRREELERSANWLLELGEGWDRQLNAVKVAAESGVSVPEP
jgi:DNA-binding transcriptional ArsR family regulator